MSAIIGIVGLGRVGMPSAEAYIKAGYTVFGYDRSYETNEKFRTIGGVPLDSPEEVSKQTETVIVMVLNDAQVIEVVTGDNGLLKGIKSGATIISMSTINRSNLERVVEQCASKNVGIVDCPFTGGPTQVPSAGLTLIAAAPTELLESVRPILEVIGKIVVAGDKPGLGQAVKHCNQLMVGTTHAAIMEVITLARKLNLDPALVCNVISNGVAGSVYFRLVSQSVLDKTPSPGGLGQMCKDLSIVINTARAVKMPAYVATAASQYFLGAEALGMEECEGADLIDVVERIAGKKDNQEEQSV